jgi:hypothetical protein
LRLPVRKIRRGRQERHLRQAPPQDEAGLPQRRHILSQQMGFAANEKIGERFLQAPGPVFLGGGLEGPSVQIELRVDHLQFRRLDQSGMGDDHLVKRAFDLFGPEFQEFLQFGKIGLQIILLPDEGLDDRGMIGHSVKNVGGGYAVTFELTDKVPGGHRNDSFVKEGLWRSYRNKVKKIKLLAAKLGEC